VLLDELEKTDQSSVEIDVQPEILISPNPATMS
jgi:hypothetical protein